MPRYVVQAPVFLDGEIKLPGEVVKYDGNPPRELEPVTPAAVHNAELAYMRRLLTAGVAHVSRRLLEWVAEVR